MRVLLKGTYNPYSGYGNDLIGLCEALSRRPDTEVVPLATSVSLPLPIDVAVLFARDPSGRYDVCVEHMPPFDLKPQPVLRENCDKVVAWTMWEQSKFTRADMRKHGQGRNPWKQIDHIFGYDPVSVEALNNYSEQPPKSMLQGGVDEKFWPYVERDWSGTFRFAMLGELHLRKDPFTAIEAFRELRDDGLLQDAELHLKTTLAGIHPMIEDWVPGVKVHMAVWSREQVRSFLNSVHCYLSPSRGEGKNLPALEVMLSGGVVIATNWGGHQVWMHSDYAFPLDYELKPVNPGSESMNARASKEHLKQLMVKAYENRGMCAEMGRIASRTIRMTHGWDAVADRMLKMIARL